MLQKGLTDEDLEHGVDRDCLQERQTEDYEDSSEFEDNDEQPAKKSQFLSSIEHSVEQVVNCCQNKKLLAKTILSGQVLSLMLSAVGTSATALNVNHGIKTPSFNAFWMYALLASTFGIYTVTRSGFKTIVKRHWWKYLIVAVLDVEANYLLTKAYSYTTLTSVQLCDSFTIPTTMVISFIFLRVRYKLIHYAGVLLCIGGAVCLIFTDGKDTEGNASNEVLGDVIALIAAVLYGTSNVGQEYLVKKYSAKNYLGIVGIVGFVVTGIQTLIIERTTISQITLTVEIAMIYVAFALCQYLYYTVMPVVMKLSSATVVNLSLLTSDLYTLMIGLYLFSYKFSYLYFVAFSGILVGLITYNIRPPPAAPPRTKTKKKKKKRLTPRKSDSCSMNSDEYSLQLNNGHTIRFYKSEEFLKDNNKNGLVMNNKSPLLAQPNGHMNYTRL